jgi:hypothetical protein
MCPNRSGKSTEESRPAEGCRSVPMAPSHPPRESILLAAMGHVPPDASSAQRTSGSPTLHAAGSTSEQRGDCWGSLVSLGVNPVDRRRPDVLLSRREDQTDQIPSRLCPRCNTPGHVSSLAPAVSEADRTAGVPGNRSDADVFRAVISAVEHPGLFRPGRSRSIRCPRTNVWRRSEGVPPHSGMAGPRPFRSRDALPCRLLRLVGAAGRQQHPRGCDRSSVWSPRVHS